MSILRHRAYLGGALTGDTGGPARLERSLILSVVGISVVLCLVLSLWSLRILGETRTVEREIADLERGLATLGGDVLSDSLPGRLAFERRRQARLMETWDELTARVDTFGQSNPWLPAGSHAMEEGRIDFKVALFNARTNLQERARAAQRAVPPDLGLQDTIDADEPAETRLWQLATVVRLLERVIDVGVPTIERVEPFPPVVHLAEGEEAPFAREFPVRIALRGNYRQCLDTIDALLQPGSYFALRRYYLGKSVPNQEADLHVELVYAGKVFDVLPLTVAVEPANHLVHDLGDEYAEDAMEGGEWP